MVKRLSAVLLAIATWFTSTAARAEQAEASGEPTPTLHHAPVSVTEPHEDLVIQAEIVHPERVEKALLVYRPTGGAWLETEFRRGGPGPYAGTIRAEHVRYPHVDYVIELETVDGRRIRSFASREAPHRVLVPEDLMDVRERVLDERLHGRRSVVSASAEYVRFGDSPAMVREAGGAVVTRSISDQYYRAESAYTYRPLRLVNEFSIRVGVVRGRSPVPGVEDPDEFDVGLNYAAPSVRLRLADLWQLEGQVLTSVTEVGFSLGAGGALHIGDPYGSKLVLGFESVQVFGTRFFSRVNVRATEALTLAPVVEVTDMPHADKFGIRLMGEAGYELQNGISIHVLGGYQAREATSGGPSAGVRLAWAF